MVLFNYHREKTYENFTTFLFTTSKYSRSVRSTIFATSSALFVYIDTIRPLPVER